MDLQEKSKATLGRRFGPRYYNGQSHKGRTTLEPDILAFRLSIFNLHRWDIECSKDSHQ